MSLSVDPQGGRPTEVTGGGEVETAQIRVTSPSMRFGWVVPVAMGIVAFVLVTGGKVIWPTNIKWMEKNDLAQHYLASAFFRCSPWSLPPGANPNYGLEIGSSTCFSVTVFPFDVLSKLLDCLIPEPFQYWGIWLALSYVLQACSGWKLVGLFTPEPMHQWLGAAFFVFSPPFLFRFIQPTLGAHWTLLVTLVIILAPRTRLRWIIWPLHLFVVATISAYHLLMASFLWLADWIGRWIRPEGSRLLLVQEGAMCSIAPLIGLWLTGLFVIHGSKTALGFGIYRMNVLSPVNPRGWSYVIGDIQATYGEWEGFQYLGLGSLILLAVSLVRSAPWRIRVPVKRVPLAIALIILTAFAITPNVGIGGTEIQMDVPSWISTVGRNFRGSGRLFWPVYYLCVVMLVVVPTRFSSSRKATVLLSTALAIQILDTSAGWLQIREYLSQSGSTWETQMKSSFWEEAAARYDKVRLVQPKVGRFGAVLIPIWRDIAYYALVHKKGTDSAYLARTDGVQRAVLEEKYARMLDEGVFEDDSLYVFDTESHFQAFSRTVTEDGAKQHLLSQVDGLWVFAPNWFGRPDRPV